MREVPADFEAKKDAYIRVGCQLINSHNIPSSLVINCDEINVQFVSPSSRTFADKGSKRVRGIGKGQEKPQITATLFITEDGEALAPQLIFGGKTNRCLPKHPVPHGWLFSFTPSHWQTPQTFMEAIRSIIVPYKNRIIVERGLDPTSKCLLKLDLHYSHKDEEVLKLLSDNNILTLFVPARCTDILLECDGGQQTIQMCSESKLQRLHARGAQ
jgi:hypothetical protein